jgi:hypothetical protein
VNPSAPRYALTWPDGTLRNTWVQVTVLANARTGLARPDVFYFGNLVGETGDAAVSVTGGIPAPTGARVNALDLSAVKRALNSPAALTGRFDFNRDGRTNALDLAAVRANLNRTLAALAAPTAPAAGPTRALFSTLAVPTTTAVPKLKTKRAWDALQAS